MVFNRDRTTLSNLRPVFATDIFVHWLPDHAKTDRYREIARKYAVERLIFTVGTELPGNIAFISQNMTHPSLGDIKEIANNWYRVIKTHLNKVAYRTMRK